VPILLEKRQLVVPGDLVAEGDYIAGDNTYKEKDKIYASRVGIVEYETKRIDVVALKSFYIPRMEDIVIGTITEVGFSGWMVDINSPYPALLRASDVLSRPFKPQKDDLPQVLDAGDLVVAKIVSYDRTHDPQLTVAEPGLGKITRGQILKVTPTKVPRRTRKNHARPDSEGDTDKSPSDNRPERFDDKHDKAGNRLQHNPRRERGRTHNGKNP